MSQVSTRRTTSEAIMRSRGFTAGVADVRAGNASANDLDMLGNFLKQIAATSHAK